LFLLECVILAHNYIADKYANYSMLDPIVSYNINEHNFLLCDCLPANHANDWLNTMASEVPLMIEVGTNRMYAKDRLFLVNDRATREKEAAREANMRALAPCCCMDMV
jgi:hypothetical protein